MKNKILFLLPWATFTISHTAAQNVLTFYVWGAGQTNCGFKSYTGHAYICIGSDYYGYGQSGMDYNEYENCALERISFNINNQAMANVRTAIKRWQNNPGEYSIGRHDCTSFAMDIADAAGIQYGSRSTLQLPMTLMERLKRYNLSATWRKMEQKIDFSGAWLDYDQTMKLVIRQTGNTLNGDICSTSHGCELDDPSCCAAMTGTLSDGVAAIKYYSDYQGTYLTAKIKFIAYNKMEFTNKWNNKVTLKRK